MGATTASRRLSRRFEPAPTFKPACLPTWTLDLDVQTPRLGRGKSIAQRSEGLTGRLRRRPGALSAVSRDEAHELGAWPCACA